MTRNNFLTVLRACHNRKPFRSFFLELINGSRLEIQHPEALTVYEELIVHLSAQGNRSVFEYGSVARFLIPATTAESQA
jgi:hypothetical protein